MMEIWRRLMFLLRRHQREGELEEEMRFHAEMAGTEFGNLTFYKEESRLAWGFGVLDRLGQDLRFGIRLLRKGPGFTLAAVLSLALGIGANTAIFSVIYVVLLRSLPVQHPEELVSLNRSTLERSGMSSFSYPFYQQLRDRSGLFAGLLCQTGMHPSLSIHGQAERVTGEMVSGNYFDVLGLHPYAGRLFNRSDETTPGSNAVVVLSYAYWQRRFGGSSSAIGMTVDVNGAPMTIVGVSQSWRGTGGGRSQTHRNHSGLCE
jgi:hypothetical protein